MSQQVNVYRKLKFFSGAVVAGLGEIPGRGSTYYVNGGSDGPTNNNGTGESATDPKQTIKAALALCTSNYNDTIYVLNYGSNARAVEDWPIVVNKDQVHIIGVGTKPNKWATVTVLTATTNTSAFRIAAQRVEIAGLEIGGTGTGAGIEFTTPGWHGCYIHDCWFGMSDGIGTNGIKVTAAGGDAPRIRIEDCDFGMLLTGSGVIVASTFGAIVGNRFLRCVGAAMTVNGDGVQILDNQICMDSDTTGHGIVLGSGASNCYIDGNHVASQKTATTANYGFIDGGTNNAWGINYSGIVADLP